MVCMVWEFERALTALVTSHLHAHLERASRLLREAVFFSFLGLGLKNSGSINTPSCVIDNFVLVKYECLYCVNRENFKEQELGEETQLS